MATLDLWPAGERFEGSPSDQHTISSKKNVQIPGLDQLA